MTVCLRCKIDKNPSEFYKGSTKSNKLQSNCKECHRLLNKIRWKNLPPDKKKYYKELNDTWVKNNKSKHIESQKQWQCRRRDKIIKQKKENLFSRTEMINNENCAYIKLLIKSESFGDQYILLDIEDFDKIKDYSISLFYGSKYLYARLSPIDNKRPLLHRFIMNCPKNMQVDHINHNTLDNRKSNLRICTHQENSMNRICSSKKFKGAHKDCNKYLSFIGYRNERIYLGSYETEEEAAKAYNKAALKYHGEFANLNEVK